MSGIIGGAGSTSGVIGQLGDGLIHVGTTNVTSAVSEIDVNFFSAAFKSYQVNIIELNPATDSVSLHMRFVEDNGSRETGNYYKLTGGGHECSNSSATNNNQSRGGWNTGEFTIHPGGGNVGDGATTETVSGIVYFMNPYQTAVNPCIMGSLGCLRTGGDDILNSSFYGTLGRTGTNYKGFRLWMSSGNIETVQILVYGMKS